MIKVEDTEGALTALVDHVLAGEQVLITRDGKAAVEIVPALKYDGNYFRSVRAKPLRPFSGAVLVRQMRDEGL